LGSTQWKEHKVSEWFPKFKSSVTPVEGVNIQDIHQRVKQESLDQVT